MKKASRIVSTSLSVLFLAILLVTPAGAVRDPFVDVWVATDIDGSDMRLVIGGGSAGNYRVYYYDYGATICGLDPDTGDFLYSASARGTLSLSGDTLSGDLAVYCRTAPPTFWGNVSFPLTYDAATDTLTDFTGVVWHRR